VAFHDQLNPFGFIGGGRIGTGEPADAALSFSVATHRRRSCGLEDLVSSVVVMMMMPRVVMPMP